MPHIKTIGPKVKTTRFFKKGQPQVSSLVGKKVKKVCENCGSDLEKVGGIVQKIVDEKM